MKLTGNPIEFAEEHKNRPMLLTVFAIFEGIKDEHVNSVVHLTGRRSWLYAGAGYGYEAIIDSQAVFLKSQCFKPVEVQK